MDPSSAITPDTVATVVDNSAVFFGYMGGACSLVFASAGAAYGTWKSAQAIDRTEQQGFSPSKKNLIPIIIAGVLAIYGLMFSIIAITPIVPGVMHSDYPLSTGYAVFGAGLTVGLCCLVSGIAVGKATFAGLPRAAESSRNFMGLCLILVYCEAIGLYGLIAALIAATMS